MIDGTSVLVSVVHGKDVLRYRVWSQEGQLSMNLGGRRFYSEPQTDDKNNTSPIFIITYYSRS